ncbi:MAG: VOC family protein [Candidatus Eremiobacteraeota bacterium]|nr:VOC family protein [Candidatus Eremiobacteraeota bacterium]MBC5828406.1 VOC family protein [Candidatus Eremiobacteraeota bacterium]
MKSDAPRPVAVATSLDHVVLTVQDIQRAVDFYVDILGMEREQFDGTRVALRFGNQKINLHQVRLEFEPTAYLPTPGSADLCFLTETPLPSVQAGLEERGIRIVDGPVRRTGARGSILSIYVRDPDGNLVEIANGTDLLSSVKERP